jgi:hypothetical protein
MRARSWPESLAEGGDFGVQTLTLSLKMHPGTGILREKIITGIRWRNNEMGHAQRRYDGKFFGRRVNCEGVPILAAWVISRVLDDPRRIPYLLLWRNEHDGEVKEAVRVSAKIDPPVPFPLDWTEVFEIKRTDGTRNFLRTMRRPLPRNGGSVRLLVCPYCGKPRHALYGWELDLQGRYTTSARIAEWKCRACARLRYASEGGALVFRSRGHLFRAIEMQYGPARSPRPEQWYPYVFSDADEAMLWIHAGRE